MQRRPSLKQRVRGVVGREGVWGGFVVGVVVDERHGLEKGVEVEEEELVLVSSDRNVGIGEEGLVEFGQDTGDFLDDLASTVNGTVGVDGPSR